MNTNRIAPLPHSTLFWRGIAALEALLLVAAIAIGLASRWPVSQVLAPVAAPVAAVSAPAPVVQQPYLLGGHGELVAPPHQAAPADQQPPAVAAPQTAPVVGMREYKRYDSGASGARPAPRNPNMPISGTGSAYNGGN